MLPRNERITNHMDNMTFRPGKSRQDRMPTDARPRVKAAKENRDSHPHDHPSESLKRRRSAFDKSHKTNHRAPGSQNYKK